MSSVFSLYFFLCIQFMRMLTQRFYVNRLFFIRSYLSAVNGIEAMVKAKKFILARHFDGVPTPNDFKLVEEELPELQTGGKSDQNQR